MVIEKKYIPAIGLSSVIFLWAYQIEIGTSGIPSYVLLNVLLFFIYGFRTVEIKNFIVLTIISFSFLFIQTLGIIELTTPFRSIVGIPLFIMTLIICSRWLVESKYNLEILFKVFKFFIIAQLTYQLIQMILWYFDLYHSDYLHYFFNGPRVSGFYREPSHVAYSLSPFIYLIIFKYKYTSKALGRFGLISLFLIFFLSICSTLIAVFVICCFFRFMIVGETIKSLFYKSFGILLLIIAFIFLLDFMPALKERVDLTLSFFWSNNIIYSQDTNLSVLAFVKGWQMAMASLSETLLGAGFLNLQYFNEYSEVSKISERHYNLNTMEGTSSAFKMIGEFGYLGLILIIYVVVKFVKNCNKEIYFSVYENLFLFGLIASFIRGASYFDGVVMIAFSLIYLNFFKKNNYESSSLY